MDPQTLHYRLTPNLKSTQYIRDSFETLVKKTKYIVVLYLYYNKIKYKIYPINLYNTRSIYEKKNIVVGLIL